MPAEESLLGQRRVVALGGVEHHLDDAFDVSVDGGEGTDVETEAARYGRAHLLLVEDFAFDFAGLDHFLGEAFEHGFGAKLEAESFHASDQPPLMAAHHSKLFGDAFMAPA